MHLFKTYSNFFFSVYFRTYSFKDYLRAYIYILHFGHVAFEPPLYMYEAKPIHHYRSWKHKVLIFPGPLKGWQAYTLSSAKEAKFLIRPGVIKTLKTHNFKRWVVATEAMHHFYHQTPRWWWYQQHPEPKTIVFSPDWFCSMLLWTLFMTGQPICLINCDWYLLLVPQNSWLT